MIVGMDCRGPHGHGAGHHRSAGDDFRTIVSTTNASVLFLDWTCLVVGGWIIVSNSNHWILYCPFGGRKSLSKPHSLFYSDSLASWTRFIAVAYHSCSCFGSGHGNRVCLAQSVAPIKFVATTMDEKAIIGYVRGLTDQHITLYICELLIKDGFRGLGIVSRKQKQHLAARNEG